MNLYMWGKSGSVYLQVAKSWLIKFFRFAYLYFPDFSTTNVSYKIMKVWQTTTTMSVYLSGSYVDIIG